jgi:hypothetical protein
MKKLIALAIGIIIFAAVAQVKQPGAVTGSQQSNLASAPPAIDIASVKLKKWSGNKDGFGNILMLNLTIENTNSFAVKDVVVECRHAANSGTVIDSNRRTIYETVKAKGTKTLSNFNMGFIHSQAARSGCVVIGFERA